MIETEDEIQDNKQFTSRADASEQTCEISWYPHAPPTKLPDVDIEKLNLSYPSIPAVLPELHSVWTEGHLKYTDSNKWQSIPIEKREQARRHRIHGVEIRMLQDDHVLKGEYGLFATQKFSRYDIIGEYTGKIVGPEAQGELVGCWFML